MDCGSSARIQIGLSGEAVDRYVGEWTLSITDLTERVRGLHAALRAGRDPAPLLPAERPYPIAEAPAEVIGATRE